MKPNLILSRPAPYSTVRAANPEEQAEIAGFLRGIFGNTDASDPQLIAWKFFAPHPEWPGSRSYLVETKGQIDAHVGVWPVPFRSPAAALPCTHLIDWAANPAAPGAGITAYQHLMGLSGMVLAIGGSPHARRVLPKLGFKPYGTVRGYARVVRPWRQFQTRPRSAFLRDAARLGRNALWACPPKRAASGGWSALAMPRATDDIDAMLATVNTGEVISGNRTAAALNYLLDCPLVPIRLWGIKRFDIICGYFLLATVHGQCRIIDLLVNSEAPADWRNGYRLAITEAMALPGTCEVTAFSSLGLTDKALEAECFHLRGERPVMLFDPKGTFAARPALHLQMVDSDAFFLSDPAFPYLT